MAMLQKVPPEDLSHCGEPARYRDGRLARANFLAPFLLTCAVLADSGELPGSRTWFFRPAGAGPRQDLAAVSQRLNPKQWTPVKLPHEFTQMQPARDAFAWYARELFVPRVYEGLGLFLDLGMIDDADVTFVNGRWVGGYGDFDKQALSAWNKHRRYFVPPENLKFGQINTIAILVKNFTGLGGFLGEPFIGASLLARGEARFRAGDLPPQEASDPAWDDSMWAEISLPDERWDSRQRRDPAWGWYRMRFDLPESLAGRDLVIDLGLVYDAASCYLNGELIGQCGKFPPEFFPQTAGRFKFIAPASVMRPRANILAVRVYNQAQFGGLVGLPSVDLELQDRLNGYGRTADEWVGAILKAPGDAPLRDLALTLSCYLIGSRRLEEALALAAWCVSSPAASAQDQQQALARMVHALFLAGKSEEAWRQFQEMDFAQPIPFEAAYSAAAICRQRPLVPARLGYLGPDTLTGPDWDLHYGHASAVLCAMGAPFDFRFGVPGLKFSMVTGDPRERPRAWLGKRETTDKRALFNPLTGKLRYSCWDDAGERHPCDDAGPDLILRIKVPDGANMLTFYLVDFDWFKGQHPRLESLTLLDERGRPLFVLGTGRFGRGRYERFLVEGPMTLTVRVSKHRSPCAVLSGLFLDSVAPLQRYPASLPKTGKAPASLSSQYHQLAARSAKSIVRTLRSDAFIAFERLCRAAARTGKACPEVLWWLAECERIRGHPWAQVSLLRRLLDAAAPKGAQNYEKVARENIAPLGLELEKLGFCNEALLLCAERYVASAPEGRSMYIRELRRGSLLWRAAPAQRKEAKK